MQRKMIVAVMAMTTATIGFAFAKNSKVTPSASVTDQDVIVFADEFVSISEELKGYNYVEDDMSMEDIARVIGVDEMERVLEKHGITGPNRMKKVNMIMLCYAKYKIEKELADSPMFLRSSIRRKIKKEFDANINPADEKTVRLHAEYLDEKLEPFFEEEESK